MDVTSPPPPLGSRYRRPLRPGLIPKTRGQGCENSGSAQLYCPKVFNVWPDSGGKLLEQAAAAGAVQGSQHLGDDTPHVCRVWPGELAKLSNQLLCLRLVRDRTVRVLCACHALDSIGQKPQTTASNTFPSPLLAILHFGLTVHAF